MKFHLGRLIDHVHLRFSDIESAYLLDPDGHNVEAVWHGPMKHSAESVEVTAG